MSILKMSPKSLLVMLKPLKELNKMKNSLFKVKFSKPQIILLVILMAIITFSLGSLLTYYWYFGSALKVLKHFQWWRIFEVLLSPEVPIEVKYLGFKAIGVGFTVSLICVMIAYLLLLGKGDQSLYGDAKFASRQDIQKSNSVSLGKENGKGIVVGKYNGRLIRYTKPDFVSLGAGTRSGKGASIVIPNLLEWQDSLIVLDIKQECFNITSKYRKEVLNQEVFLFNPFSYQTHKFNPLHYVNLNSRDGSTDLMGISEIIFPTDAISGAEGHFNNVAQSLFIALAKTLFFLIERKILFLKEYNIANSFSLGNIFDLYKRISTEELIETLQKDIEYASLSSLEIENATDALDRMRTFSIMGDESKASTVATFEKQLKLFALPVIKNATNINDFDFRDMRRKKMTIYLSVEPKDIKIASLILNLFFNCAIKINLSENPDFNPDLKHNLLLILDEFPAIGKIPYVKEAAGYIAGYRLQLLTIFQNVSQLNEIYGMQGRKTLLANHSCKIVFAPNEQDDAEYFSSEIAYITTTSSSESRNHGKMSTSRGESSSQAKRALMLPQELKQMTFKEEIVLLNGENPIKCEKALYYDDPYFMNKLITISPTLKENAKGSKLPSKEELGIAMSKNELAINIITN